MTHQTILVSKKNRGEPIQIYTCLNNGELIDQTQNIKTNSTKVSVTIT